MTPPITVHLNGQARPFPAGTTCEALVRALTGQAVPGGSDPLGIALALDGDLVPRGLWARQQVHDGARVELVTAVQGG